MTELSKTAAAAHKAVQRSQKREAKELTTEDRIRNSSLMMKKTHF